MLAINNQLKYNRSNTKKRRLRSLRKATIITFRAWFKQSSNKHNNNRESNKRVTIMIVAVIVTIIIA